jgi:hypothetical protein
LAAVTGSLLQSAQLFLGAYISAQCGSWIGQLRGCFLDGPVDDRRMVGRLIALVETLISLEARAPRPAETRLPECGEQEEQDEWNSMMKAMVYYKHDRCFAVVAGLIDAVANGQLKVLIDRVFPLAEAAQAHRHILERKAFGRVLLRP